ncbi:MAG: hypothetical protein ACFFDW_06495 [Candidatus Thorarchaeota archaeon]
MEKVEKDAIINEQDERKLIQSKKIIEIVNLVFNSIIVVTGLAVIVQNEWAHFLDSIDPLGYVRIIIWTTLVAGIVILPIVEYGYTIKMVVWIDYNKSHENKNTKNELLVIIVLGFMITAGLIAAIIYSSFWEPLSRHYIYFYPYNAFIGTLIVTGLLFFVIRKIPKGTEEKHTNLDSLVRSVPLLSSLTMEIIFICFMIIQLNIHSLLPDFPETYYVAIAGMIHGMITIVCQGIIIGKRRRKERVKKTEKEMIEKLAVTSQ